MTQRGEEFAKLPAGPSPRPPGRLAGGHSWVLGTLRPRPAPRRGVGGRTSAPLARAPAGGWWSGLAQTGRAWVLCPPLCFPLLPPPLFQMYNVNARKSSRKKGAENFLMRKGITSGGRREPENCVWGSPSFFQEKTLGSRDRGLLWRLANRDSPCLPGPQGAWVRARWIGDSAAQSLNAPRQPPRAASRIPRLTLPKLIEWKA